jgi:hypothetical protein
MLEEDRQGGVISASRAYFRDPDGTVLAFIDRQVTSPARQKMASSPFAHAAASAAADDVPRTD